MGMSFKDEIHIPYFQNMLVYFDVKSIHNMGLIKLGWLTWNPCLLIISGAKYINAYFHSFIENKIKYMKIYTNFFSNPFFPW